MIEPSPEGLLYDEFLGTPEMEAWDAFVTASRKALEEGAETVALPTGFLALILPELSSPLQFAALRQAWDRICDDRGHPELKTPVAEQRWHSRRRAASKTLISQPFTNAELLALYIEQNISEHSFS